MREILVILKKDIRRLWWQIAVMLAISVTVGCLDASRAAAQPHVVEGLLNMLIPLVWACLIAEAIHGEALVGDREFWMTRPYRWPRLLASKALFAVLVVHVPSFLMDAAILAARGYNPFVWLPQLLVKQLLLASGLTLPALALATLVNNLTQFVIGIPLLFVTLALSTGQQSSPIVVYMFSPIAHLAIAILAVAATWIVLLQYRQRRTKLARMLAVSALVALGVSMPLVAYGRIFDLNGLELPAADIHARMELGQPNPRLVHGPFSRRVFTTLPFKVTGLPESDQAWMSNTNEPKKQSPRARSIGDFETFFPNMPEAAEAQLKIANIQYQQMDGLRLHACPAGGRIQYWNLIMQYPDNPKLVKEGKERLLEVQEVFGPPGVWDWEILSNTMNDAYKKKKKKRIVNWRARPIRWPRITMAIPCTAA